VSRGVRAERLPRQPLPAHRQRAGGGGRDRREGARAGGEARHVGVQHRPADAPALLAAARLHHRGLAAPAAREPARAAERPHLRAGGPRRLSDLRQPRDRARQAACLRRRAPGRDSLHRHSRGDPRADARADAALRGRGHAALPRGCRRRRDGGRRPVALAVMVVATTPPPPHAQTLVRPPVVGRLDFARKKPVTWVWAPPGAGKTTLVASYLAARKTRGLWYQIDEGDADVSTFFYSLRRAPARGRRPLPLLTREYRHGVVLFARRFFRELYSRLKPPFAVVFDNYQDVARDSALQGVMAERVREAPSGGRGIFITGSPPPPAFARHRLHRHLEILDGSQLRFTPTEAVGLARELAPGRRPRAAILSLYAI